jgi:hypothetical protein
MHQSPAPQQKPHASYLVFSHSSLDSLLGGGIRISNPKGRVSTGRPENLTERYKNQEIFFLFGPNGKPPPEFHYFDRFGKRLPTSKDLEIIKKQRESLYRLHIETEPPQFIAAKYCSVLDHLLRLLSQWYVCPNDISVKGRSYAADVKISKAPIEDGRIGIDYVRKDGKLSSVRVTVGGGVTSVDVIKRGNLIGYYSSDGSWLRAIREPTVFFFDHKNGISGDPKEAISIRTIKNASTKRSIGSMGNLLRVTGSARMQSINHRLEQYGAVGLFIYHNDHTSCYSTYVLWKDKARFFS